MNFTISKNVLSNALQVVNHAVSSNSPQPPLRGIKIDAKDGKLIITGSDADISIQKELYSADEKSRLNIIEEGSILIETKYLLDLVRKIDTEEVKIEIIDGSLSKFSGNHVEFKINGMNPDNYPDIDFSLPEKHISIPQETLREIIYQTAFATSQKETRPVLMGVNFHMEGKKLICTATDSYRLAKKVIPFESESSFTITIPAKTLNEVNSLILTDDKASVDIYMDRKKVMFITEGMVLQSKLLDGTFPDTSHLIPTEFTRTLTMNRMELIDAIDRTTFIKNDNITVDRLECSADEIVLTNKNQEIGESHEVLIGTFEGEPLDISFSGMYMMSAAKAIRGNEIKICFTAEMRPFILKDENDDSIIQLVLPVRTYN